MKYFFDCEFWDDPFQQHVGLISLGIVSAEGVPYYAENKNFNWVECEWASKYGNENALWLIENVQPRLTGIDIPRVQIARQLKDYIGDDTSPEFWASNGAYDWVCLTQLYGFMNIPRTWPQHFHEFKVWAADKTTELPKSYLHTHNALDDAHALRWSAMALGLI